MSASYLLIAQVAYVLLALLKQVAYFGEQQLLLCWFGHFGCRGSLFLFLLKICQLVDALYEHKHSEGNDDKVDNGLYKCSIVDSSSLHGFFTYFY